MSIKKLFLALSFIFSFQIKAFSHEESSLFLYFDSCDFNKYGGRSNDCVQLIQPKKLKDYSSTLNSLQQHFKLLEENADLPSRLCYTFSLEKNEPICPIPLPQFSEWIQNYEFSCFKENKFDYYFKKSDNFDPLCPIPLPQFNNLVESYKLYCSSSLSFPESHDLFSESTMYHADPICPIPLPQ